MKATDLSEVRSRGVAVAERQRLAEDVAEAARLLAPMWPLEGFIAVNPLDGLLERGFEAAVREAGRWLPVCGYPSPAFMKAAHDAGRVTDADLAAVLAERHPDGAPGLAALHAWLERPAAAVDAPGCAVRQGGVTASGVVDDRVAAFCAAFTDEGAAGWALGGRTTGLYRCWRTAAVHDPLLRRHGLRSAADLPADPEDAILEALARLGVPQGRRVDELRVRLARLPGWGSYARWRQDWAGPDVSSPPLGLVDLLAVRLSYEVLLGDTAGAVSVPAGDSDAAWKTLAAIWLEAHERRYRDELLGRLDAQPASQGSGAARAQLVFCIDARSERLRRHLEALGPYATYGFAGFFGFPVAVAGLGERDATPRCPVLMRPEATVRERPAPDGAAAGHMRLRERLAAWHTAWRAAKSTPGAAFALVEMLGWWLWPAAILRTAWPRLAREAAAPTVLDAADTGGLPLEARIRFAEAALSTMGLTRDFAPLVVLCGHRGRTAANPHAASLDCGACAGAPGGPSARVAAAALNAPDVRSALAERGIRVSRDTWFVAAEHTTTTDAVAILDHHLIPERFHAQLARLTTDLATAGARCAAERVEGLPGAPAIRSGRVVAAHLARRAADWAQLRPEWGLARNAAFVVGPRSLTAGVDLAGRVFLHSYAPELDPDASLLEGILAGPVVVAQWINAQYYFSSVDPDVFGAGDKTLHNPVGGIGVLCGDGRDLRIGLPWQSVAVGKRLYHDPLRLLVVVQAPLDRLDAVIARNTAFGRLVEGQWLHLAARSDEAATWHVRRQGAWQPWLADAARWGKASGGVGA